MSASTKEGLFAVCGSFIALSTVAVSLRAYARKSQKVPLGFDDWFALFGVITYIAAAALGIEMVRLGQFGYDNGQTAAQKAAHAKLGIQVALAYDFLNLNTLACAKLSALFMYRRIFVVERHSWFSRIIIGTMVIIALWYITSDFLSCYQCRSHFSAPWTGQFKKYCDLNPVWAEELAISDMILDIWILVLPVPLIMKLRTTIAKKLAVFGVFLLAFVGLGAAIARVVFFFQAKGPEPQTLYIGLLESGMSITVVNLPSIHYLCTSTIPSRVAHSLRSIRTLGSVDSQASRSRSESEVHPKGNDEVETPTIAVHGKSSWSSQGSLAGNGNTTDVEAWHTEADEAKDTADADREKSTGQYSRASIHVRNDVEIRRE
ncbi:Hypothetical predicted protein [Lecanosticta acicola]|uniref:Rhodopsin domain-containing protein n=1 Tax=Lecanosticta acicola TaxID=111012 RepID=A0AAI8YZE3_9PEZI|nr:Hypothetical predicted protein [Lecanosticta acicola]